MPERNIAVILAAGKGTRMASPLPKVMHEVLGVPMIGHVVRTAIATRCEDIAVVVGHQRERVEAYLRERFPEAPLRFYVQDQQLGTGHAVQCALPSFKTGDAHVAVLCGDVPNIPADLLTHAFSVHAREATPGVVITADAPSHTSYGRIVRDDAGSVQKIVEFKDADAATRRITEINSGTYVFDGGFLREQIGTLNTNNAQKELYLTDLIERASHTGRPVHGVKYHALGPLIGVNTRADLAAAAAIARDVCNAAWMQRGVSIVAPQSTWIDADCQLETDVTLEPGVVLKGRCHIGQGAYIEANLRLENRRVEAGEHLRNTHV